MSQKTRIAYLVVGWNNRKLLADCFKSISEQKGVSKKIIYIDNASSDNSVEWVSINYPEIEIVAQKHNGGFAQGNNIGLRAALEDPDVKYIALINTDARLDPNWSSQIVNLAKHKPKGACFQGTTLDYKNRGIIDSTHIYISHNGQGTQGNWRFYNICEIGPKKVFGVNAAACLISRSYLEAQPTGKDLFDVTLYMYLEDVDLAARSTILGWDNYLVPGARAYHIGSVSSSNRSSTFSLYMTFRNNSGVIYKNFPWRLIFRILPKLIRGDIDTLRTLWRTNRKRYMLAVIKGRFIGLLRLPLFIKERSKLSKARDIDSDYLWLLMDEGY